MKPAAPETPFPCPFCHSARVSVVGGGLVFLHYQCAACSEVWTAMVSAKPAILRPATTTTEVPSPVARNEKLWLN